MLRNRGRIHPQGLVCQVPDYGTDGGRRRGGVVPVEPSEQNGLIMVDKPQTPLRNKLGPVIGRLDDASMVTVSRVLSVFLGLT